MRYVLILAVVSILIVWLIVGYFFSQTSRRKSARKKKKYDDPEQTIGAQTITSYRRSQSRRGRAVAGGKGNTEEGICMSVRVPRKHVHRSDVLCDVVDAEEAEKRERESSVLFSSLLSSGTTAMRELVGLEPARGSEQDTYADFSESAKNAVEKLMIGQLSSDADSILESLVTLMELYAATKVPGQYTLSNLLAQEFVEYERLQVLEALQRHEDRAISSHSKTLFEALVPLVWSK